MKTIKIRFIKYTDRYTMQRKTWLGWKDLTYTIDMGYGSVVNYYENKQTDKLLDDILKKEYHTTREFVDVIEYPMIKVY
jgi:hypothetical protein